MKWIPAVGSFLGLTMLLNATVSVAQTGGAPAAPAPDALPGRVVDVRAGEFYFLAPDTIPAGITTFRLLQVGLVVDRLRAGANGPALVSDQGNATRGLHMLWVVRLEQGKSAYELLRAVLASEPTLWAQNLGGPGFSLPPRTTNATLKLDPGNYALICHVGAATGDPTRHHLRNGMFRALTVTGTSPSEAAVPAPDVVARIIGGGTVELSKSVVAGRQVVRVENTTLKDHEFKIQQVPAGKSGKEWLTSGGPGTPWAGLASVPAGGAVTTTIDFEAGDYVVSTWPAIRHPTSQLIVIVPAGR